MNHLRKLFFLIIASAIVVDALFDFLAVRQTYLADAAHDAVVAAYQTRRPDEPVLEKVMEADEQASAKTRNQMIFVSLIDLVLMLIAVGLWISFDRANRKNEKVLRSTIARSELANRELQQLIARRAQQLKMTVHDLKNPLGSIRGFSGLIEEDRNDPTSVAELSQSVQRLSDHTLELVNSILELETADSREEMSKVRVAEVLKNVCDSLSPQLLNKKQTLSLDLELANEVVAFSHTKLWDVFTNLVGNAVKFSPIKGEIAVRAKSSASKLVIEVEDSGPGFSEIDKQKALVNPGPLSAKPTGGEVSTGLGLHSSYNFIRQVGGDLKIADAESGRGARLIIELPAADLN